MQGKIKKDRRKGRIISEAVRKAKRTDMGRISAQDTIPVDSVYADGTARYGNIYSRTVRFYDTSYIFETDDVRNALMGRWKDLLSGIPSGVSLEFTFLTRRIKPKTIYDMYRPSLSGDGFDDERKECADIISKNEWKYSKGLEREKYITVSLKSQNPKAARVRLSKYSDFIASGLLKMGAAPEILDRKERLCLLYNILHISSDGDFTYSDDILSETGLTAKDIIAPSSFRFSHRDRFQTGNLYTSVSFLDIRSGNADDRILCDLISCEIPMVLTMHVTPFDKETALRIVSRKVSDVDQMKIGEQKKAVRGGYDMDILSAGLQSSGKDAELVLKRLRDRGDNLFTVSFIAMLYGETPSQLENSEGILRSAAAQKNIVTVPMDFLQEAGLRSSLPLGVNDSCCERALTTDSLQVFFPFTAGNITMPGKESISYGMNALTGKPVLFDRKKLRNPNGLIFGMPGGGKSFAAKYEILASFLCSDDDILICDPESEYSPLVKALGGEIIHISPISGEHINPLDIFSDGSGQDPIPLKSDFIVSLCEEISGNGGISQKEKSIIDRCVPVIYEKYLKSPLPENMPVLGDLYSALLMQPEPEAKEVAAALEIYTLGSCSFFNHRTDINTSSRIIAYDIRELGTQLKKLGMLIVQDQVWNRLSRNRKENCYTRYYIDEMHLLLSDPQTAAYISGLWKRMRKWGGIPTGITQNVRDVMKSRYAQGLFENTDYICMMHCQSSDRELLSDALGLSVKQNEFLEKAGEGEGLICCGGKTVPFGNLVPSDTNMYRLMTTKPGEYS